MGCFLAASFLRVVLPQQVLHFLGSESWFVAQASLIRGRLFRHNRNLPGFREWLEYAEEFRGSSHEVSGAARPNRYLQYLSAIVEPESADQFDLQVPHFLSFLHYLHRPVRLFRRNGVSLFERLR
jgi:hypothetical protein